MKSTVYLTPEAESDLAAIFVWYENQREGLGHRLLGAAEDLMVRIAEMPKMFPEVTSEHRRACSGVFRMESTSR